MDGFGVWYLGMSHVQWLWLMVGLQLVLFGLGWLGAANLSAEDRTNMRGLGMFNVGVGIGLLLVGMRGYLPYYATHALSNVCSMLSFALLWRAALAMTGDPGHEREQWTLALVGALLLLWFGRSPETGQQRVTVYFLVVAWIAFRGCWQVSRRLWSDQLRWTAAIMLITGWLLGGLFLGRGASGLMSAVSTEFTFDSPPTLILAYVILAAGFTVNLVFANLVFGRMVRQLRRLSRHDMLTGLYNRRAIADALQLEWQRYRRGGPAFSVACIDVDLFKSINDRHGHAAGDQALVGIAGCLQSHIRPGDVIGRSGGEEFWALLMCTDGPTAAQVADRMRQAVAEARGLHPDPGKCVTVSIGVALACSADASIDAIVARADAALYRAKHAGRNQVFLAQDDVGAPVADSAADLAAT